MSKVGGIEVHADLRSAWAEVRDQGARGSCLACAASDVHRQAHGLGHSLSVEYLFWAAAKRIGSTDGLTFEAAADALREDGQPAEQEWPYMSQTPTPWCPPETTTHWRGGLGFSVEVAPAIAQVLSAGLPVILGVSLTQGFARVRAPSYIIDESGDAVGGHAVVAVGHGSRQGQHADLLLIRNSWGSRWGADGYAWLPTEYLTNKLIGCRVVTALK
jgi:hypothetical protein